MRFDVEEYAGFGRRAIASIIDTIIFSIVSGILFLLINGNSNMIIVGANGEVQFFKSSGWYEQVLYLVVTIAMWMKFLGTPGKLLMGCHVVDANTKQPLSLSQALVRYVGYFVSLIPFGLGFFWILWDKRKQGFHDKLAKSVVIVEHHRGEMDESQKTLEQLIKEVR